MRKKTTNANLAGLPAPPCKIGKFSCVPPNNDDEKPLDPH